MTVLSSVASYVIPRPFTDVFYSGYKVYCFSREGEARNVEQQRSYAEKMIKTFLRIVVSVPFAFINFQAIHVWKWDHIRIGLVYHFITCIALFGSGYIIADPSSNIALSTVGMITSLTKCAQLYPYSSLRACFAFHCVMVILSHHVMQIYDHSEQGILDARIQSWAKTLSRKYF